MLAASSIDTNAAADDDEDEEEEDANVEGSK